MDKVKDVFEFFALVGVKHEVRVIEEIERLHVLVDFGDERFEMGFVVFVIEVGFVINLVVFIRGDKEDVSGIDGVFAEIG